MVTALLVLASAEATSKTPFYIAGGALVVFAILISALGISRAQTFPASGGARAAVVGVAALLVAAAMATAVLTG
jgi:hypothetical protein